MLEGFDVSVWQDYNPTPAQIDFDVARRAGLSFSFIRASYGLTVDEDWKYNWAGSKKVGPRGAYHYLLFNQNVTEQARFFANLLAQDPGEIAPVADVEDPNPPSNVMSLVWGFVNEVERITGRVPLIYTSWGWWNSYGSKDVAWTKYPLWLAQYTSAIQPIVPLPWKKWVFWQYTNKGDGKRYGVESAQVDMDRFDGSLADLYKLCGLPTSEMTLEEKVELLWKAHPELHG